MWGMTVGDRSDGRGLQEPMQDMSETLLEELMKERMTLTDDFKTLQVQEREIDGGGDERTAGLSLCWGGLYSSTAPRRWRRSCGSSMAEQTSRWRIGESR